MSIQRFATVVCHYDIPKQKHLCLCYFYVLNDFVMSVNLFYWGMPCNCKKLYCYFNYNFVKDSKQGISC
jgi:hypothetical protein